MSAQLAPTASRPAPARADAGKDAPPSAAPPFADTSPRTRPPVLRHTVGPATQPGPSTRPAAGSAAGLAPTWCLRFLSGVLRGRTITLKPGGNVLGSGADCEVMLPASEVTPRHLILHVGELVVSLQRVGTSALRLNGEEVRQPRKTVVAGDVVTVGRIEFQLDQVYPVAEEDDPMFAGPPSVLPDDALTAARRRPPAPRGNLWAGAGLALLSLAGLAGLGVWHSRHGEPPPRAVLQLAEVEKVLLAYPETEVIALPGGQFNVKGYVETRERRLALRDAMAPFGRSVSVNVHSVEDMREQARRYVSDPGIAISYVGRGRLEISGTVDDETVRQKVRRLSEDLHPSVLVSDRVQYVPRPPRPREVSDEPRDTLPSWQRTLPSPVVSITSDQDGLSHIQLANGTRYYEGARLRSGVVLTRIHPDHITVRGEPQEPR